MAAKYYAIFLLISFLLSASAANGGGVGIFPPTCNRIECPSYDVIDAGNGFEIRRYNSTAWISTSPILDVSLVNAGSIAFYQLFDYIQGKNEKQQKMEMTAPVITQVNPSNGPWIASSFVVSFYIPKENQATAPAAEGLHVQKWGTTYVAVRQFSGFVKTEEIGEEVAALRASIAGTVWSDAWSNAPEYIVAQYNSPFEFKNRVNEIWFTFYLDNDFVI